MVNLSWFPGTDPLTVLKVLPVIRKTPCTWSSLSLCPITFQAFTDMPHAVSHSFLQLILCPHASWPPWLYLCVWVWVHVALVSFWLVSQLVFPFTFMLLCDLPRMYVFHLVSPQHLYPYVFHIQYMSCLFSP